MIAFAVSTDVVTKESRLSYIREEYSLTARPALGGRGVSIVVNDVQLFFGDDGRVLYVSGYCPHTSWLKTTANPPTYSTADLILVSPIPKTVQSGTGVRVNDMNARWSTYKNTDGWICLGNPSKRGNRAIEFAPQCVAVLESDQLVALWLKPDMV